MVHILLNIIRTRTCTRTHTQCKDPTLHCVMPRHNIHCTVRERQCEDHPFCSCNSTPFYNSVLHSNVLHCIALSVYLHCIVLVRWHLSSPGHQLTHWPAASCCWLQLGSSRGDEPTLEIAQHITLEIAPGRGNTY